MSGNACLDTVWYVCTCHNLTRNYGLLATQTDLMRNEAGKQLLRKAWLGRGIVNINAVRFFKHLINQRKCIYLYDRWPTQLVTIMLVHRGLTVAPLAQ